MNALMIILILLLYNYSKRRCVMKNIVYDTAIVMVYYTRTWKIDFTIKKAPKLKVAINRKKYKWRGSESE